MAKIIFQDKNFTFWRLSKQEYEQQEQQEQQDQQIISTDLENDPEIHPSTDVIGDQETSEQLADVLRRMTKGEVRRSVRNLDQLHVTEKKANQPAPAPEATRSSETTDALVAAMQRARETKSKE